MSAPQNKSKRSRQWTSPMTFSFQIVMAFFPMSCVLRVFKLSTYDQYAKSLKTCEAELIKKNSHFYFENNPI